MRVITSKVVNGKVEIPRASLEEGLQVAVLAPDVGQPVELTPAEQEELTAAMEEIRRGEFVTGTDLLAELRSRKLP